MNIYDSLNEQQKKACFHTEGPLLLLAGAGSGKTRVLTHRIAYIIENGLASPYEIMAITFTNKAAKEMASRVDALIGENSRVFVSTFHSACVRFLRRDIDKLGFSKNFVIYDTVDSKKVIKDIVKRLNLDSKYYKESVVLSAISGAKSKMLSTDAYYKEATLDFRRRKIAEIYEEYQNLLKKNNALDFGDLLYYTVKLFTEHEEVLRHYQNRFKYILVDEYQDTNLIQFKLTSMLAGKHNNICVVGDDDQSIYKFRGADITNILSFENHFNDARVIKLEQNYRSTKTILDAANSVIKSNYGRKAKRLWTENNRGDKIDFYHAENDKEEARIISDIVRKSSKSNSFGYNDFLVLYRTNAQSRAIEERLIRDNIPYKIFGGVNFYSRKEVKDFLAYLRILSESNDDVSFERIINYPKRGIGDTSVNKIKLLAQKEDVSLFEVAKNIENYDDIKNAGKQKMTKFVQQIESLKEKLETSKSLTEFAKLLIKEVELEEELKKDEQKGLERIENIYEVVSKIKDYEDTADGPNLTEFLMDVALISDIDNLDENSEFVTLMTIHSAKGLEFPYVFIGGMEDGLFPSYMSINEGEEEVEEERRLCYVGITRAQKKLTLLCAKSRMMHGSYRYNTVSRFVEEIPENLIKFHKFDEKSSFSHVKEAISTRPKPYKNVGYKKPTINKHEINTKKTKPDFGVGDLVMHKKFGVGQVMEILDAGADYEIKVNFPSEGIKRLMASLSGIEKADY